MVAHRYAPSTQFVGNAEDFYGRSFVLEPKTELPCFRFSGQTEDDPPMWVLLYAKTWQGSLPVQHVALQVGAFLYMLAAYMPSGRPGEFIRSFGRRWVDAIIATGDIPHMTGTWQKLFAPEIASTFGTEMSPKVSSNVRSIMARFYESMDKHAVHIPTWAEGTPIVRIVCHHDTFASGKPKVYDFSMEVYTIRVLATYTRREGTFHLTSVSKSAFHEMLSVGSFLYVNHVIQVLDDPLLAGLGMPGRQLVDSASAAPTKRRPR